MLTEKLRVVQLFIVMIIASQGMFYLLAAAEALKNISVPAFAEQRKAVDIVIGGRLRVLYYSALLLGLVLMILMAKNSDWKLFALTMASTLLLVTDVVLALKYSQPINQAFRAYPNGDIADWRILQLEWIRFIIIRGIMACIALVSLLYSWSDKLLPAKLEQLH